MTSSPTGSVDPKTLIFSLSLKKMPIKVEISMLTFEASGTLLNVKKTHCKAILNAVCLFVSKYLDRANLVSTMVNDTVCLVHLIPFVSEKTAFPES